MVVVEKKKGDTKESIFRKFSKIFIQEDIVDQVRSKMYYKRPSQMRKEEEKERLKKRHKSRR
jgi:ribosomal protein S21